MSDEYPAIGLEALGADGEILWGAFMPNYTGATGPVIGFSHDGKNITLINSGKPVFDVIGAPQNVARDFSLFYQPDTSRFYTAFTAGDGGRDGYFSIYGSLSLRAGTWVHETDVCFHAMMGGFIWGPDLVEDDNGDLFAFFSACASQNITNDLRIYRVKFNDPHDLTRGHTAPVLVTVPNPNQSLNEVRVFRAPDGTWRMAVFNFQVNAYQVYSSPAVDGAWTLFKANMGLTTFEGIFALDLPVSDTRPNGGWRVYVARGTPGLASRYGWVDLDPAFQGPNPEVLTSVIVSPHTQAMENGQMIRVRSPLAGPCSQVNL
jgi:hypothetical protein